MERNSRKLIKLLEKDGWRRFSTVGSHHHFRHSVKKGRVTVPHPNKDIKIGTLNNIYEQAGWQKKPTKKKGNS